MTEQYPGIPDRVNVHCPLCLEELTLMVQVAEVTRVVNEEEVIDGGGNVRATVVSSQRVEAEVTYSRYHLCKKLQDG